MCERKLYCDFQRVSVHLLGKNTQIRIIVRAVLQIRVHNTFRCTY